MRWMLLLFMIGSMVALIVNSSCTPAPPVNQRLGTDDGIFNNLTEVECRGCHDSASNPGSSSNVDRHHLINGQPLKQGQCSVSLNVCLSDDQCNAAVCEINGTTCSADADCPEAGLGETCGEVCRGKTSAPVTDADHDGVSDSSYGCLNCHRQEVVGDQISFIVERNCLVCHIQVPGEGSVHHLTQMAQGFDSPLGDPDKGDCTPCHGTIVDDIGDGHVIPVYKPSPATPAPSGGEAKPINREGNGAGACDYCHSTGTGDPYVPGVDYETGVEVYSNRVTHHGTGVYLSETGAIINATCVWCHYVTPLPPGMCSSSDLYCQSDADCPPVNGNQQTCVPADFRIRRCEGCHGFDSLHNIAADSDTGCFYDPADPTCEVVIGGEAPGFSHVGNDEDCMGCHGFSPSYAHATDAGPAPLFISRLNTMVRRAGTDTSHKPTGSLFASGSGPASPSISGSDMLVMNAGTDTPLTLTGAVFTNLVSEWQWVSRVRMTGDNGLSVTLIPTGITAGSLTVTIPGLTPPGNYRLTAVKMYDGTVYAESNPVVISIRPCAVITRVTANGDNTLTINGSGFGEAPPAGAEEYIKVGVNGQPVDVFSWTDTLIRCSLPADGAAADSNTVTVSSLFCNATASFRVSN